MLTAEEIAVQAMARIGEFTSNYPSTRSVMYRRIGVKQEQMAVEAAELNHEYFGVCASVALNAGAASLLGISDPIPRPEQIQDVTINGPGTSPWATGKRVTIVPQADHESGLPPRVTIRDRNLRQVGNDLNGVESVMIYYTKLPEPLGPEDGDTATAIPSPHDEILVVDLARHLLRSATAVDAAVREMAMQAFAAEEAELTAKWQQHVARFGSVSSRFARPPAAPSGTI